MYHGVTVIGMDSGAAPTIVRTGGTMSLSTGAGAGSRHIKNARGSARACRPGGTSMAALGRSIALCAALLAGLASPAGAQLKYPEKPVRFVLSYGPGGVADVTTRLIAQKLGERMGQNFIIENKPGAGGILAAKAVLSSPPDGYTFFLTGNGSAINQSLFKTKPFNVVTDFTSVATLAEFEMLLATKADSKLDTIGKLV